MPDRTVSNFTARIGDFGVMVTLRMSSTDLTNLLRYGTVSLEQVPRVVPVGSVHVGQVIVDLI